MEGAAAAWKNGEDIRVLLGTPVLRSVLTTPPDVGGVGHQKKLKKYYHRQ